MKIDCGPCSIRPWEAGDLHSLVKHADDRRVWLNLRDLFPHPYTEADGRAWLDHVTAKQPGSNFAIDFQGHAVGGIGLRLKDDVETGVAEVGYWLGHALWGKGLGTVAVKRFTAWAFSAFDLRRIVALPFAGNVASRRVLEKAGYRLEGVLRDHVVKAGVVQDQAVYAILRRDSKCGAA